MMDRREFVGIMGAGILFPAELAKTLGSQGTVSKGLDELPGSRSEAIYYMSYMRTGSKDIYRLWPSVGIVMGVTSDAACIAIHPRKSDHPCRWQKHHDNLYDAIKSAPSYSLIMNDGFAIPYIGCGDFWHHNKRDDMPIVLHISQAETLASDGHLSKCKPFCTFEEYLKLGE